ncbi:hypothetical protein HG535_0G03460 [Zygotorulaspora mrakii]|uniref:Biogenesis of lysosome-related organelles complex 1 subunit BLI1 n=1 Tax=Zygotorulaspora mrakii TaxID=42260 RepID=A0A7H9B7H9_ZYGMR|nr:uncharacterized protein HG535_0G03460 [Zygotorulaspora mrakii]QLG74463.1 hypothetical protein HG535_0G03460 [Zygotorulaspora mrakii]
MKTHKIDILSVKVTRKVVEAAFGMKEPERSLRQDIEHCVDILQDVIDTESTKSISIFSKKTNENERWLEQLKPSFQLKNDQDLQKFQELKNAQTKKLNDIEQKIDYYERLFAELEEIQNELEVKAKLEKKRRSRANPS